MLLKMQQKQSKTLSTENNRIILIFTKLSQTDVAASFFQGSKRPSLSYDGLLQKERSLILYKIIEFEKDYII